MRLILLIALFSDTNFIIYAQDNVKTYTFKKGEVLDILLLSTVPDSKELFDRYKQTAFPVAFKYSYKSLPGFKIAKRIMGSQSPSSMILGKWDNKEKREGFINNISKEVPDFHQQRLDLFKHFDLTYYVMPKDITFSLQKERIKVVTALWQKDKSDFSAFIAKWQEAILKTGGEIIAQLREGVSPVGYYYNPDLLVIVEWENEQDFQKFVKLYPLESYVSLKNVDQFIID